LKHRLVEMLPTTDYDVIGFGDRYPKQHNTTH
jgi:hypothetical protein